MFDRLVSAVLAVGCTGSLLACIPGPASIAAPVPSGGSTASPAGPVERSADIAGKWDIVRFSGHAPRRLQGTTRAAYADFGADGVALRIECNYSGANGRVEAGQFRPQSGDRPQTAMGCGPEREARDAALFGFFDLSPTVELVDDGRLRLVAGEQELLLERPEQRRLAFVPSARELLGEWKLQEITRYHPQGGYSGIGLSEVPGHLAFDGMTVRYSPCPQLGLEYRYTAEGRIEKIDGAVIPAQPVGCDALKAEPFGRDMPLPWDVLRVLHDSPLAERVDQDTLLISNGGHGVLLTRIK